MTPQEFVALLAYKPKWISDPNIDDVSNIEFNKSENRSPYIEFGTEYRDDKDGQYFYYEILDYGDYNNGDFISLTSDRRHDVILSWPKTKSDFEKLAKSINQSLKNLYSKPKNERSLDGKPWISVS